MASQISIFNPTDTERINVFYTQEQAVFQKTETNKYIVTLSDYRHHILSNFSLKLCLPEVRGKGKVAYVANFLYLQIRELNICIINRDGTKLALPSLTGYDLYRLAMNSRAISQYNDKMNNSYCKTRKGKNSDSIIFEKQEVFVHLTLPSEHLIVLPHSQVEITLELENDDKVLTYNSEFEDSLNVFQCESTITSKNLTLQFSNYVDNIKQDGSIFIFNRVVCDHGTTLAVSNKFDSALKMLVYVKPHNFQSKHRYLMNPSNITDEEELKKTAIENFKNDLIKTEEELQTDPKIKYVEIPESGEIKFKKSANVCKIQILNRPKGKKFFFHNNILSYSRRSDIISSTNISEYFRRIEVIYTPEKLIIKVLEHAIPLEILCVPINFWTDPTNTSTGDLRSEESKMNDFFYENMFLNSIDFLNDTLHIESLTISITDRQLTYEAKHNLPSLFPSSSSNVFDITLSSPKKPIQPIAHLFERFQVKMNWKQYPFNAILHLYKLFPVIEMIERGVFTLTHDRIEMKNYSY